MQGIFRHFVLSSRHWLSFYRRSKLQTPAPRPKPGMILIKASSLVPDSFAGLKARDTLKFQVVTALNNHLPAFKL